MIAKYAHLEELFLPKGSHHKKNYENLDEIKYRFAIFEKICYFPNFSRKREIRAKSGVFWPNERKWAFLALLSRV